MKNIQIHIDTSHKKKGLPWELLTKNLPKTWSADESIAFALIAVGTAPPRYVGFTLADTWAHQRYAAALDPFKTDLVLRTEWKDLDPHQKTILADDWGVGFPLLYLTEKIALKFFSPTGWWIQSVEQRLGRKLKIPKKKKGPPKLPDYIGIDAYGYLHALECKGTQQSQTHLYRQIAQGVTQVQNLQAGNALPPKLQRLFRGWMVGGLFVPQSTSRQSPLLVVADPDFDDLSRALTEIGDIAEIKQRIRQTMLCQQLSAIGLPRLATTLFNGRTSPNEVEFLRSKDGENGETRFMELQRTHDRLSRTRSLRVFDLVEERTKLGPARSTRLSGRVFKFTYSAPADLVSRLTETISANGQVDMDALQDVLDDVASLDVPIGRKRDLQNAPSRESGWITRRNGATALLHTPFGIEIETSSQTIDPP